MTFVQTGRYPTREVSYTLSYGFSENDNIHIDNALHVNLELEFSNNWTPPIDLFFDTSEDIHSSVTTLTQSNNTIQLPLDLYISSTESSQKLILHAEDTEQAPNPFFRVIQDWTR